MSPRLRSGDRPIYQQSSNSANTPQQRGAAVPLKPQTMKNIKYRFCRLPNTFCSFMNIFPRFYGRLARPPSATIAIVSCISVGMVVTPTASLAIEVSYLLWQASTRSAVCWDAHYLRIYVSTHAWYLRSCVVQLGTRTGGGPGTW